MADKPPREQAEECFRRAYQTQMKGALDDAITLYRKSIESLPTAEAHTSSEQRKAPRDAAACPATGPTPPHR